MDEQSIEKVEFSLTTIYDINRAIFRHLPIRSIDSCSLVCPAWAELARQTKSIRRTIHTLTYPVDPLSTTDDASCFLSDFDTYLSSYIHHRLWSIPYVAFVVVTNDLEKKGFQSCPSSPPPSKSLRRSCSDRTAGRKERMNVSQALTRHLNKSCQLLMVASEGIIATNEHNQSNEVESGLAMGILLLPKFPSNIFGVYPFELPSRTDTPADISRTDLYQLLGGVPNDAHIRCVVFFLTRPHKHVDITLRKLLEYHSPNIVIIGGFINKIQYDNRRDSPHKASIISGMVFTGDEQHVNIRQVILLPHLNQRQEIENKLKELQINQTKSTFSLGIQVSCVARGSEFYQNQSNIECSTFRNIFPHTPLIGIFGNGEIGHDYLPKDDTSLEQNQFPTKDDLFLTYSSVFSLISINL